MPLTLAAIRSGTDPAGPLPPGAFHRTLETSILCPKCDVIYNVVADYEQSTGRHFEDASHALILKLKKAIFMGHGNGHRVSHFETSGVSVLEISAARSEGASRER